MCACIGVALIGERGCVCIGETLQNMANIESVRRNVVMINCDLFICSDGIRRSAILTDHWVLYKCNNVTPELVGTRRAIRDLSRECDGTEVMHILAFY